MTPDSAVRLHGYLDCILRACRSIEKLPPEDRDGQLGLLQGIERIVSNAAGVVDQEKPPDQPRPALCCSFCGKSQAEVRKLIAGPSVFICNECVALCSEIIDEEDKGRDADDELGENGAAAEPAGTERGLPWGSSSGRSLVDCTPRPKHEEGGVPRSYVFARLLFNPSTSTMLVVRRSHNVPHPSGHLYHRRADSSRYVPTMDTRPSESVDAVVVASAGPTAVALVREWGKWRDGAAREHWAEVGSRLVAVNLEGPSPKTTEIDTTAAPWHGLADLLSISDDGSWLFCVACVGEKLDDGAGTAMRYGIYRWKVGTDQGERVAELPGTFW